MEAHNQREGMHTDTARKRTAERREECKGRVVGDVVRMKVRNVMRHPEDEQTGWLDDSSIQRFGFLDRCCKVVQCVVAQEDEARHLDDVRCCLVYDLVEVHQYIDDEGCFACWKIGMDFENVSVILVVEPGEGWEVDEKEN